MKTIFLIILLSILASCDFFNSTRICNNTDKKIEVIIDLNENVLNRRTSSKYKDFATEVLFNFHKWNPNLELISMDSVNYIGDYYILPDSCAEVEGGNNRRPYFDDFTSITILTENDSIVLDSDKKMRDRFGADRKETHYYFDLIVN